MSSHMGWREMRPVHNGSISTGMKQALRERFFGGDETAMYGATLTKFHVLWLEGMVDAGGSLTDEACELLQAIKACGEIEIVRT